MAPTGEFECSDPLINQLQHNIVWGQKGNFVDVPTDCPQRDERLGWTGDAQVFARTAAFNCDVAGFFTKWLQDLARQPSRPTAPSRRCCRPGRRGGRSAGWADAGVIVPGPSTRATATRGCSSSSSTAWRNGSTTCAADDDFIYGGLHYGDWLALDHRTATRLALTDRPHRHGLLRPLDRLLARCARRSASGRSRRRYAQLEPRSAGLPARVRHRRGARRGDTPDGLRPGAHFDLLLESARAGAAGSAGRRAPRTGT